jgi:uncharacterized repeat protein (TIGR01451 family)
MKSRQLLTTLTFGLGLTLVLGLFTFIGRAAPGESVLDPPRNSHTVPLTTTVSITYDEPISAATVTSRTFAVHGMQSGLMTANHSVSGGRIVVTPTRPFHQGELVYAIATTGTLGLDGAEPLSSTQWQFNAGTVVTRCVAGFTDISAELTNVSASSVAWGDYDNDGDLDILLTGSIGWPHSASRIYCNDSGTPSGGWTFTDIGAGLPGTFFGSAAWGDYDNDGDLDILLTGSGIAQLYRNDDCVVESVDLTIIKTVTTPSTSPGQAQSAAPGDVITYTLTFSNTGNAAAIGVVITDAVPVSVTISSVISSGVSITDTGTSPSYVWQVQDLAPSESGVITITGVLSDPLPDGHTFTNTAVIATTAVDDDPSNNQASAAITVTEAGKDWYIYLPLVARGYAP